MKILLTGGTGFLGTALADELIRRGHSLVIATRSRPKEMTPYPAKFISWPIRIDELENDLSKIEACINLTGEPIAQRWTVKAKDRIYDSRIGGTRQVVDVLRSLPNLKVFLSGSAIGYYGDTHDKEQNEKSPAGKGFLAEVCQHWEVEAQKLEHKNARIVLLRTGVVLGRGAGILKEMEPLFRNKIGGPVGSGDQFLSWIHVHDWVQAVVHCLDTPTISGPVNLTAPDPTTNKTFAYSLGKIFGQKFFPPAPAFALRLLLGEMADMALQGQRVIPKVLLDSKFGFKYPELRHALEELFQLNELNSRVDEEFFVKQWIPATSEEVFKFFSDERNLEKLTPQILNFRVIKKSTSKLDSGTLIDYKISIHGVPTHWRTRIDDWVPGKKFSDSQIKGPYKKWHHTHSFEPLAGGVLMTDRVLYRLPFGELGRIGGHWFVKRDIRKIFRFRRQAIWDLFPGSTP